MPGRSSSRDSLEKGSKASSTGYRNHSTDQETNQKLQVMVRKGKQKQKIRLRQVEAILSSQTESKRPPVHRDIINTQQNPFNNLIDSEKLTNIEEDKANAP